MELATVNKIIPFSSVDGPGNRTAIFLQGCNFKCKYCHNPETINGCINCGECVKVCKTGALYIKNNSVNYDRAKCVLCDECIHTCRHLSSPRVSVMSTDEVIEEVAKNVPFIRGITVSGGECTKWRNFLVELLAKAKEKGINTLLDSNGSYRFEDDPELMAVTDGVMLDVKAWDSKEHENITGSSNENVIANLRYLLSCDKLAEVRVVVVPELFDARETVKQVSYELKKSSHENVRLKIIKYRSNGVRTEFKDLVPPTDKFLLELKDIALSFDLRDIVLI